MEGKGPCPLTPGTPNERRLIGKKGVDRVTIT